MKPTDARLEHPHILPVHDFDGAHESPYIVVRYVESGTLKEVVKAGHLPLPELPYLVRQVCAAVDYAHRQGIIHRGLKPSNFMIDHEGIAFVTDFGIARLAVAGDGKQITETGTIIGTLDYMSPEQAMSPEDIDQRTDIYALGVMTYEMLTGELPFQSASSMGVLMMHVGSPIPNPSETKADLPEAVDEVIARTLSKNREEGYRTAVDFAEALVHALGGTVTNPLPVSATSYSRTQIGYQSPMSRPEKLMLVTIFTRLKAQTDGWHDCSQEVIFIERHLVVFTSRVVLLHQIASGSHNKPDSSCSSSAMRAQSIRFLIYDCDTNFRSVLTAFLSQKGLKSSTRHFDPHR